MKIERFEAIDRCLFWKEKKILIVGDLHLGYEEYLNEMGWSFPKTQVQATIEVFERIFKKIGKVKEIIILGDIKHYFGGVLASEMRDVDKIFNLLKGNLEKDGRIIIIKGNHDAILEPVVRNYNYVELKDFYELENILFIHGDKESFSKIGLDFYSNTRKRLLCVIGHFHPAIIISRGAKAEKYRCFLYGKSKELKKEVIIVPSFFPLVEGTDVSKETRLEGRIDVANFEVFAIDETGEVYDFGKVKEL